MSIWLPLAMLAPALAGGWRVAPAPGWASAPLFDPGAAGDEAKGASPTCLRFDEQLWLEGDVAIHLTSAASRVSADAPLQIPLDVDVALHRLEIWRGGAWLDLLPDLQIAAGAAPPPRATVVEIAGWPTLLLETGARTGEVLRYAWSRSAGAPLLGERYVGGFDLAWSEPCVGRRIDVQWSEADPLRAAIRGDGPPPTELAERHLRWDLSPLAATRGERWVPADVVIWPWVQVSEFSDWTSVAVWAAPLYALGSGDLPDLDARLTALRDQPTAARALAALRLVQDEIAYAEAGPRRYAPRPPSETLALGSGDCKDKALLLVALLRALEIEAWPVLVSLQGDAAASLPSPEAFDHVIVYATPGGPGEAGVWLDPTLARQGGPLAGRWRPDYGRGLILRPGEVGLAPIPRPAPGAVQIERAYTLDGVDAALEIRSTLSGGRADALRERLATSDRASSERRYLEAQIRQGLAAQVAAPLEIEDDRRAGVLQLRERYRLRRLLEDGAFGLAPPAPLDALPEADPGRVWPLSLPIGLSASERITVGGASLPEAIAASVQTPWFSLTLRGAPSDEGAALDYALEVTADRVAVEDLSAWREALREAEALGGIRVEGGVVRVEGASPPSGAAFDSALCGGLGPRSVGAWTLWTWIALWARRRRGVPGRAARR